MNIIFLDIDGVLNCQLYYKENPPETRETYPLGEICQMRVGLLNDLCKEINAKVVISSTWRLDNTVKQLRNIFEKVGATFEIIDKTPNLIGEGCVRGNEINLWIEKNKDLLGVWRSDFHTYAIIDDDSDMLLWQKDNFFQTDNYSGLTPTITYKIKKFFEKFNNNVNEKENK